MLATEPLPQVTVNLTRIPPATVTPRLPRTTWKSTRGLKSRSNQTPRPSTWWPIMSATAGTRSAPQASKSGLTQAPFTREHTYHGAPRSWVTVLRAKPPNSTTDGSSLSTITVLPPHGSGPPRTSRLPTITPGGQCSSTPTMVRHGLHSTLRMRGRPMKSCLPQVTHGSLDSRTGTVFGPMRQTTRPPTSTSHRSRVAGAAAPVTTSAANTVRQTALSTWDAQGGHCAQAARGQGSAITWDGPTTTPSTAGPAPTPRSMKRT